MEKSFHLCGVSREQAEGAGYAVFNRGQHVCIDVPNGHSTITCRTSTGELLTFAFIPYAENGAPACVDVHHKTAKRTFESRDFDDPASINSAVERNPAADEVPAMNVICFSGGNDAYRSVGFPGHRAALPTTLVGILLH